MFLPGLSGGGYVGGFTLPLIGLIGIITGGGGVLALIGGTIGLIESGGGMSVDAVARSS